MSIRFHDNPSGPYPRPGGYNAAWHQIELADERLARGNFEGAQTAIYQASRILYDIKGGDEDYYMAVTKTVYAMVYMGMYSRFHDWKLNTSSGSISSASRILIPRSQVAKFADIRDGVKIQDEYFTTRPKFFELVWKKLDPTYDQLFVLAIASKNFHGAIEIFEGLKIAENDGPFMLAREGLGRCYELKGNPELARKHRSSDFMLCSNPDCVNETNPGYTARIAKYPCQLYECPTCGGSFFCGWSCSWEHDQRCPGNISGIQRKWLAPGEFIKDTEGVLTLDAYYKPFYYWYGSLVICYTLPKKV